MSMRSLILFILAVSSISAGAAPSEHADCESVESYWSYEYLNRAGRLILDGSKGTVYLNDVGVEADFCASGDRFYCVSRRLFTFAVPKELAEGAEEWSFAERNVQVLSDIDYASVFGTAMDIRTISMRESVEGNELVTYFFYSRQFGLLGFQLIINNGDPVFAVSKRECGFGSG